MGSERGEGGEGGDFPIDREIRFLKLPGNLVSKRTIIATNL
jgi:hypothetical protein